MVPYTVVVEFSCNADNIVQCGYVECRRSRGESQGASLWKMLLLYAGHEALVNGMGVKGWDRRGLTRRYGRDILDWHEHTWLTWTDWSHYWERDGLGRTGRTMTDWTDTDGLSVRGRTGWTRFEYCWGIVIYTFIMKRSVHYGAYNDLRDIDSHWSACKSTAKNI